jgi:murein DD-endopeptidase MepM/ murein hydrolase activator NlpD
MTLVFTCSCATRHMERESGKGVYHVVNEGETLWRIARAYNVSIQDLAEANNITDATSVDAGAVIFIPDAKEVMTVEPAAPADKKQKPSPLPGSPPSEQPAAAPKDSPAADQEKPEPIRIDRARFIWPVHGVVSSRFGIQPNGMRFNGITIDAPEGTSVVAASDGKVIHSSPLKYYGETVIIKHENGYSSVYAHLKDRRVQVGDTVKKGDAIAVLGNNKKKAKSCLHFEIRQSNKPRNPLFYLPKAK